MHELPRQKLCELINQHGTILCEDAKRCESFLRDVCTNQYRREITHANPQKKSKVRLFNPSLKTLQLPTIQLAKPLQQLINLAMTLPTQPMTQPLEALSPFKPIDYLRLLWWVLVMPQQLYAYRQAFGLEDEQRVGKWLASFLLWGPLFLLTFTLGFGLFHHSGPISFNIYLALSVLIIVSALLTVRLKINKNQNIIFIMAFLIAFGVAFAVALGLLDTLILSVGTVIAIIVGASVAECVGGIGRLSYVIALGIVIGMTIGIVGSFAGNEAGIIAAGEAFITTIVILGFTSEQIENSLESGIPSLLARFDFLVLIVTYLILLVFYIIQLFR